MFPWFLLALRLKHRDLWKKAAGGKQEGYRGSSIPAGWRKVHSTQSWGSCQDECWLLSEMLLSHCSPAVWGTCSHLLPSLGWHSKHTLSAPWLAGFQRRQSTLHQVPGDVARGPWGWVLYPQQTRPSWPWRRPWVSTGTCKLQTRSSAAAPALWAQMEALQEQKTISGWPSQAAVACPSWDEAQPFAASPRNRCCSKGEPAATLAASTEGLRAYSWGGQTSAAQLRTSFI